MTESAAILIWLADPPRAFGARPAGFAQGGSDRARHYGFATDDTRSAGRKREFSPVFAGLKP
jgi:hypothetical protein